MRKLTIVLAILAITLPAAAAAMEIDETRPLRPGGSLEIEIVSGAVQITGWDQDQVSIRGTIDDRFTGIEIDGSGDSVSIEVEPIRDSNHRDRDRTDLVIHVPRDANLELESISASFAVDGIDGELDVETVSGALRLSGGELEVSASTISGRIVVEAAGSLRRGDFESVSGTVEIHGALAADGRFSFETVSGDITLHLPSDVSARFEIETFSGDIHNDFGVKAEKTSIYLPAKELSFEIGSGGARVDIASMNGDIRLTKN
jgi:DUF4097 and DUF4098 domain-containing protein YvlB